MSIESLKEQARRHEQKEEWRKALDQYKKAIARLEADDQPDIGLYNRVGDLYVRVGQLDDAVDHYDKAAALYLEAELPNNAIAVCKKIIRNVPNRHKAYLRMGQIRAHQGFLPDARANFLTYAERMQQAGDLDESFRALVEFCDLAPEEVDVRLAVADQMASHERVDEAVEQLAVGYRALMHRGALEQAEAIGARIRELDPDADLSAVQDDVALDPGSPVGHDDAIVGRFGDIEVGGAAATGPHVHGEDDAAAHGDLEITRSHEEALGGAAAGESVVAEGDEGMAFEVSTEFSSAAMDEDAEAPGEEADEEWDEGEAVDLPLMEFSSEEGEEEAEAWEEEGDAVELPLMSFGDEEEGEALEAGARAELDAADFGEVDQRDRETEAYVSVPSEVPALDADLGEIETPSEEGPGTALEEAMEEANAAAGAEVAGDLTLERARALVEERPDDVELRQRMVELAYQSGDERVLVEAFLGLGTTLQRGGQPGRAKTAFQQALQLDPDNEEAKQALGEAGPTSQPVREVASHEDYVDLGSLILGDESEKTTRFVVAYEEPSGDEAADFAKMLSQFKEKVSENLGADDVRAHHDLGTAYLEMGLLDEAVTEFQQALRASADHLPTYELLGQTFMEMGKPDAAVRSLRRALEVEFDIEDELIAIYYYLARAYEKIGDKEQAVEFYDRVFSLDINFADVTERLRALR